MNNFCDQCHKSCDGTLESVYGVLMCNDCWDEYLSTDAGAVEYIISLVSDELAVSYFDADFLGYCAIQWYKNKDQFDIADEEILIIEEFAERMGIL